MARTAFMAEEAACILRSHAPRRTILMARAIWKGSITFGLVNIPVGLYSAETRDEISFPLLDQKTTSPIHYKRVSEESGKEVPWDQTVRGDEFSKGKYVVMADEALKRAAPEATQTIDIVDF